MNLSLGLSICTRGNTATPSPPADATVLALYDPARGATVAAGAISALADQSGTGDAAKNLTATPTSPTYNAADAAYGGRPTIQFGGANRLDGPGLWAAAPIAQPLTIYVVGAISTTGRLIDGVAGARASILRNASGNWAGYAGVAFIDSAVATGTPAVLCGVFSAGSSALYIGDFVTAAIAGNPGNNNFSRACLGALSGGGGEAGSGSKLAMAIVCSGAHSAPTRAAYRAYFASYFGL